MSHTLATEPRSCHPTPVAGPRSALASPPTPRRHAGAAARRGPRTRTAHRSNLHPTKAKRRGGQHEPPASAGRLVPSSPLARRGGRAAGQNAQQQTPDENQQIRHLTAADMVGVELPNTFLLEKPPGAPRHRNHSRRRRHPKLNYIHARPPGPVDLLNRMSRFGAPPIVSESRQTANRFISTVPFGGF